MKRKIIAKTDIEQRIANELAKHQECDDVQVLNVYWHIPDETGCNWDADTWRGDSDDVRACKNCILEAVRELRARYNIFDPA
jgi:hypothetical protein